MNLPTMLAIGAMLACPTLPAPANAATGTTAPMSVAAQDYVTGAWTLYRSRFLDPDGRIVDDGNAGISHSEGQGSGMLLAVAADDQADFERIWSWTRRNLMVRGDALAAWKWDPGAKPHVADTNNATDGDLLIAWALLRASRRWGDSSDYTDSARAILAAITREAVVAKSGELLLLPGANGFGVADRPDGPVVNLSYWVFPALDELGAFDADFPGDKLIASGLKLVQRAQFGPAGLPADWISTKAATPRPAEGFPAKFGYDAIRVPLYLSWYGDRSSKLLGPFAEAWSKGPIVVDLPSGHTDSPFGDPGYHAVADLLLCSTGHKGTADPARDFTPTQYYPSMLGMLSLLAMAERYPECLTGSP